MSGILTDDEKREVQELFGETIGKQFLKIGEEFHRSQEKNKEIADARWEVMQTKLDTIISELRK